ncbi:MAG: hypothetical protein GX577_12185 [Leptolinea sp.]|nr:hypothetical protein [Leptolinea sp.]
MFAVFFILQDTDKLNDLLDGWEEAGSPGVTILPSIGLASLKEKRALQEDFPIIPNLEDLIESSLNHTRTLFSLVKTQEVIDALYKSTIDVIGDLDQPHTGIFFVLPVHQAFGIREYKKKE